MIVCSCRNIRSSDYPDIESLKRRLKEDDKKCGICESQYNQKPMTQREWERIVGYGFNDRGYSNLVD